MAKGLLETGADPNHCNRQGDFPILLAAGGGFIDILKLLIKFGGKVDFVNQFGSSAIHNAANGGHCEVVKFLLKHGLPHDTQTHYKQTPLSLAANNGHIDVMKILLPLGCNVNTTDRDGNTSIQYFAECGKVLVEGVQLLLKFGADPDRLNDYGCSALWRAVYWKQIAVVKELIGANVKLDVPTRGMIRHPITQSSRIIYDTPKTPLYVAIDKGNLEIGMLLVRAGCNIHKERWILDRHDIPTDEKNAKVLAKLVQCVQTPFRLSEICRNYFRQMMGHNIHKKVMELSLPQVLKDYLTLKDLLSKY